MYEFLAIFGAVMALFNYVVLIRIFLKLSEHDKENEE